MLTFKYQIKPKKLIYIKLRLNLKFSKFKVCLSRLEINYASPNSQLNQKMGKLNFRKNTKLRKAMGAIGLELKGERLT